LIKQVGTIGSIELNVGTHCIFRAVLVVLFLVIFNGLTIIRRLKRLVDRFVWILEKTHQSNSSWRNT